MRSIDELRQKHAGQDIYVIGSGASMNHIEPGFFDGKITIGLGRVYLRFKTTYTVIRDPGPWVQEAIAAGSIMLGSEYAYGDENQGRNDFGPDAYVFRAADFPDITTAAAAIHIAAEMGAANIILCGFDGGTTDGNFTFDGYYRHDEVRRYFHWRFVANVVGDIRATREMVVRQYGCRVYSLSPFVGLTTDHHEFRSAEKIPNCRHCGAGGLIFYCGAPGGHSYFYKCNRCGCISSNMEYEDVACFYSEPNYAEHHNAPRAELIGAVMHNCRLIAQAKPPPQMTCLDVGCLEGAMLEVLEKEGWQTQGWDIDAKGRPEGTIIGDVFRAADVGRQFGLVISREVIEHVPDHRAHLQELAAAVMPGGFLHLQAPRPHGDLSDQTTWQTTHLQIIDPGAMWRLLCDVGLMPEFNELWPQGQLWHARKPECLP